MIAVHDAVAGTRHGGDGPVLHMTTKDDARHAPARGPDRPEWGTEPEEGEMLLRLAGILPTDEFLPFVIRAARALGLRGWVQPVPGGALIRAVGPELELARLVRSLWHDAPASARLRAIDPDAIDAETPAIGAGFIALLDESAAPQPLPSVERVA